MEGFYKTFLLLTIGFLHAEGVMKGQLLFSAECPDVYLGRAGTGTFNCAENGGYTWNDICFLVLLNSDTDFDTISYADAVMKCPEGYQPANIYNDDHFTKTQEFLLTNTPGRFNVWIGMKFNPRTTNMSFYNGTLTTSSNWDDEFPARSWNLATHVYLYVDMDDPDVSTDMNDVMFRNSPPVNLNNATGIICEPGNQVEFTPDVITLNGIQGCKNGVPSFTFGGVCYSLHIGTQSITYNEAVPLCTEGSSPANIENRDHYLLVMTLTREHRSEFSSSQIWLGMTYDTTTQTLKRSDGTTATFVQWEPQFPASHSSRTQIGCFIQSIEESRYQGMYNSSPTNLLRGILCEQD